MRFREYSESVLIPMSEFREQDLNRLRYQCDPVFRARVVACKRVVEDALRRVTFGRLRKAIGVMKGAPADAVIDTERLYDDRPELEER